MLIKYIFSCQHTIYKYLHTDIYFEYIHYGVYKVRFTISNNILVALLAKIKAFIKDVN